MPVIAVTFCNFKRVLFVQMYSLVSFHMEVRVVCVLGGHCRKVQCCVCKLCVNCKHAKNSLTSTTHDTAEREQWLHWPSQLQWCTSVSVLVWEPDLIPRKEFSPFPYALLHNRGKGAGSPDYECLQAGVYLYRLKIPEWLGTEMVLISRTTLGWGLTDGNRS